MFSVIIPARTITHELRAECFPALDNQSERSFEVFVVIHESCPDIKKLHRQYPWLTILHKKQIVKPGNKRDLAAKHARGTYLAFLDDDAFPHTEWLAQARRISRQEHMPLALGGPGMLPPRASWKERLFDAVLCTPLGSGSYTYRVRKESPRHVDDYPSMNLLVRRDIFLKLGGFGSAYWPGEDSKLAEKLGVQEGAHILYHPEIAVYHHRRDSLRGHLRQHANYGKMRGTFAAHGDKNSRTPMYIVPAIFVLYMCAGCILIATHIFWPIHPLLIHGFLTGIYLYLLLLVYTALQIFYEKEDLSLSLGALIVIPATHITYGIRYLGGIVHEYLAMRKKLSA